MKQLIENIIKQHYSDDNVEIINIFYSPIIKGYQYFIKVTLNRDIEFFWLNNVKGEFILNKFGPAIIVGKIKF